MMTSLYGYIITNWAKNPSPRLVMNTNYLASGNDCTEKCDGDSLVLMGRGHGLQYTRNRQLLFSVRQLGKPCFTNSAMVMMAWWSLTLALFIQRLGVVTGLLGGETENLGGVNAGRSVLLGQEFF